MTANHCEKRTDANNESMRKTNGMRIYIKENNGEKPNKKTPPKHKKKRGQAKTEAWGNPRNDTIGLM